MRLVFGFDATGGARRKARASSLFRGHVLIAVGVGELYAIAQIASAAWRGHYWCAALIALIAFGCPAYVLLLAWVLGVPRRK